MLINLSPMEGPFRAFFNSASKSPARSGILYYHSLAARGGDQGERRINEAASPEGDQ